MFLHVLKKKRGQKKKLKQLKKTKQCFLFCCCASFTTEPTKKIGNIVMRKFAEKWAELKVWSIVYLGVFAEVSHCQFEVLNNSRYEIINNRNNIFHLCMYLFFEKPRFLPLGKLLSLKASLLAPSLPRKLLVKC